MKSNQAFWGAIYQIINHAICKSVLFLNSGIISEAYGTRNVYDIRGAFRSLPLVSVATILAILGLAGAPFFSGSMSKYWISYGAKDSIFEIGIIVINIGTIMYFTKLSKIFWGKPTKSYPSVSYLQNIMVMLLGSLVFIGGVCAKDFINIFFKQYLLIDPISYMEKAGLFIVSTFFGGLFYYKFAERSDLLKKFRSFEPSFNDICLFVLLFFSFLMFYMRTIV